MRVSGIIKDYYSLTASQQNRVNRLIRDMFNLNAQLADIKPEECPKCGSTDGFTKAGFEKLKNTRGNALATHMPGSRSIVARPAASVSYMIPEP